MYVSPRRYAGRVTGLPSARAPPAAAGTEPRSVSGLYIPNIQMQPDTLTGSGSTCHRR